MSDFLGALNKNIAVYVSIKLTGNSGTEKIYTMIDDEDNILIWQTEKIIENSDGCHYFLVEGKVKEHKEQKGVKQTVLKDCDWELIGITDKIEGWFYGKPKDVIELNNVTASYRKVVGTEWIINGEFAVKPPVSEYYLIIARNLHTFVLPYDSTKRLNIKSTGKFNIRGRVLGYMVKNEDRITFLYPLAIEDKNAPFYSSKIHGQFLTGLRK